MTACIFSIHDGAGKMSRTSGNKEKQKKTLRGKRLFCWFVNCIIKKGGENFSEFNLISVCMILPVCELKMFEL